MKAAVLTKLNALLEVLDVEYRWAAGDQVYQSNQVLVEIQASGICGAQLKEIQGEKGNGGYLPHCLGHEAAGIVRDVGQGVNTKLIGQKVVCHWRRGAGGEAHHPAIYDGPNGMVIGGGHVTTLSEMAVVSANRVTPVPSDAPDELCALLGCGLSTALGTIEQEAKLRFGESILIVGCGGVGLNLIMAAKLARAYPIMAMDVRGEKAETCKKLGAHYFVNARGNSSPPYCGLSRFDVIVDTSGSIEALEATIPLLADGGRYVCLGQPKPQESMKVLGAVNMFHGDQGRRIIWSQGGGFRPSEMITRYISLWRSGALDLNNIISHRIGLNEINEGIELVRKGQAGRVMVAMR